MNDFNPRQLSTYALTLYRQVVYINNSTDEVVLTRPKGAAISSGDAKGSGAKDSGGSEYSEYSIDYWDTAGQEVFTALHPSYYYGCSCCILAFDVTRKITYSHLTDWFNEYNSYCARACPDGSGSSLPPCILVANKIDVDYNVGVSLGDAISISKGYFLYIDCCFLVLFSCNFDRVYATLL